MPQLGWKLNDGQVAAVATYIRAAWGNSAPSVDAAEQVSSAGDTEEEYGRESSALCTIDQ
jgi:mono/diheme cytochrome c family protein